MARLDKRLIGWAVLTVSACGPIPRDPEGTLVRVRHEAVIRVGHIQGEPDEHAPWRPVLARIARETRARPVFISGGLEPLLLKLERGEIDLVVGGRFDANTPWKTRVSLSPPLTVAKTSTNKIQSHIVARNGENAWIVLIQRSVQAETGH